MSTTSGEPTAGPSTGDSSNFVSVAGDEEIQMSGFKVWCNKHELSADTVAGLEDQGFNSVHALSLMQEDDVEELALGLRAQVRLLQNAIQSAKNPPKDSRSDNPMVASGKQTLVGATAPEMTIDALLNNIAGTPAPEQVNPATQKINRPEFDPTFHLLAGKSGSSNHKPLEILDFVGMSVKIDQVNEQIVSEVGENHSLILKSGPKKPKYESLTIWQWCLGAVRIQDELVRLGRLQSELDKRQYWGYICKVLELNGRFEWQSILEFDKEYRSHQARFEFAWGTEIPHLCSVQLKDKKPNSFNNSYKNFKGKQSSQSHQSGNNNKKGGNNVQGTCRDFNRGRCVHNPCRFQHICAVDGCGKPHPATQHDSQASQDAKN